MTVDFRGTNIKKIYYNDKFLTHVYYDGTKVFEYPYSTMSRSSDYTMFFSSGSIDDYYNKDFYAIDDSGTSFWSNIDFGGIVTFDWDISNRYSRSDIDNIKIQIGYVNKDDIPSDGSKPSSSDISYWTVYNGNRVKTGSGSYRYDGASGSINYDVLDDGGSYRYKFIQIRVILSDTNYRGGDIRFRIKNLTWKPS